MNYSIKPLWRGIKWVLHHDYLFPFVAGFTIGSIFTLHRLVTMILHIEKVVS